MSTNRNSSRNWASNAGYCVDCGKKTYWTRRHARAAARVIDKSMSAYPCGALWHIGHLPSSIVTGQEARDQFRERTTAARRRSAS